MDKKFETIIEPFRIKSVEPLRFTTQAQRCEAIETAGFNLFALKSQDVLIDLLTDSGTGAMSSEQWAGMMRGDESYAGSPSFHRFERVVSELTGFKHVIPTHQGRAAERILFAHFGGVGKSIVNNTHFDTTRANVEASGALAVDIAIPEALQPMTMHPFKGNVDLDALTALLSGGGVSLVMVTVTNNSGGGQPVSMSNLKSVRKICDEFNVLLYLDACRFAENAWFVSLREEGYGDRTPRSIAEEMFRLADGATFSAKKDGLSNIGGFLACNDDASAQTFRNNLILTEGFPTYGGLAGYDLEAIAQGLLEVTEPDYLRYRIRSVEYLWERCRKASVPAISPPGGHAVYLDAAGLLPHIPPSEFPAQALAIELYRVGGVRTVEIGSVMFGKTLPDGTLVAAPMELVRLAIPRRVYTQSHIDYVCEVVAEVASDAASIRGYRFTYAPDALRHFTARFEPVA